MLNYFTIKISTPNLAFAPPLIINAVIIAIPTYLFIFLNFLTSSISSSSSRFYFIRFNLWI